MQTSYIDPGATWLGWAIFDGASLLKAGLSKAKSKDVGARAREHHDNLFCVGVIDHCLPGRVVAERMTYRVQNAKGNPQVEMDLNLIAGHVANHWVTVNGWKGNMDKIAHLKNVVLPALRPDELALLRRVAPENAWLKPSGSAHNMISAVGIGLFDVGRIYVP